MITTETPIGEVINFLYKNDSFYEEKPLFKEIRNLVDLIIIRSKKDGVAKTFKYLESDLFKLRLDILNESNLFQDIIGDLNNSIQERIKFQFKKTTNHKNLELAFVNSISIYGEISSNLIELLPEKSFNSFKHLPQLNYEDFTDLLRSLPGKESKLILSYLNSSISLDYALIVSELIFDDKLRLKKSEIENLILILKNSIEEYAVFSYRFGFWSPSNEDESQWIRNIKIRISLFESKFASDNDNNLSSNDINEMLVA